MNITTLEQASKHLIDCGVVAFELGSFPVEGKQLLDVCGYSLSNPRIEITRQIVKHDLTEGVDFMRNKDATHQKAGQAPKIYHFSLNAANHILLAAMTDQGKAARQDAIDTKTALTDPTLPPELANDPIIAVRMTQIAQEKRISAVENQVQQMTTGAPLGWAILTRIGEMYGFSKQKSKAIAEAYELEQKPISVGEYGVITRMVKTDDFKEALGKEMKATALSGSWFKSPKLGRYAAKGLFLKQYTEKVLRVPFDSMI
ncbi:hypothetical protein [Vibrio cyclitrophicus]|uniref:hypothetical protein n=1 Tax=Vibrio cyclitrophicus TaxID=47951 RepID=UPI00036209AE|nr:hypothetical protein [Vibrio cyclitrophicus]OEF47839.1 hypothetical protein OAC_18175 [Vibrio cyclitrophicus 1F273]